MDYLDFELRIGVGTGADLPVEVLRSPAGERRGISTLPWTGEQLRSRLGSLESAFRGGGVRGVAMAPERAELSVPEFGKALFRALMPPAVEEAFRTSRALARQAGKGLRIRLRVDAPAVAALPWELLYDEAEGDFVSLSAATPIVRHLELGRGTAPLAIRPPLRILAVASAPSDLPSLSVARERERMTEALAPLVARGEAVLTWLEGSAAADLQAALGPEAGPWHVFHFIGHGGFDATSGEGLLMLTGSAGRSERFPATQLGRIMADHGSLRLAVLNACDGARGNEADRFSSVAATLMRRGLPAVVAMQHPISDAAAVEFSREFYGGLAQGLPVDGAVAGGRKAVSLNSTGGFEWSTPVLHLRAADSRLFDFGTPTPAEEPLPPIPGTGKFARVVVPLLVLGGLLAYAVIMLRSAR